MRMLFLIGCIFAASCTTQHALIETDLKKNIPGVWGYHKKNGYSEGISFGDNGDYQLSWCYCGKGGGDAMQIVEPIGSWSLQGTVISFSENHEEKTQTVKYEITYFSGSKLKLRNTKTNERKTFYRPISVRMTRSGNQ